MPLIVVKKDGRTQRFEKAKIEAALNRSGAGKVSKRIAGSISKKMAKKAEVRSSEIRDEVIRHLHLVDNKMVRQFASFRKAIRKMASGDDYLENRIRSLVGKSGQVDSVYGGFKITVMDEAEFDFAGVMREVLSNSKMNIGMELKEGRLSILVR